MIGFGDFIAARRRGCLLGALAEADRGSPGQTVAPDVLHKFLLAIGMRPTLHQVQLDMQWLADHQIVEITRMEGAVFARVTQHGREAAARRVQIAGLDVTELEG